MRTMRWMVWGALCCCAWMRLAAQPAQETGKIRYVRREFLMPYGPANPPGLDVLEVRVESEAKRPLAMLTHGTAYEPRRARM